MYERKNCESNTCNVSKNCESNTFMKVKTVKVIYVRK